MGVASGEQSVGNFVHLAVEAVGREGTGTGYPVLRPGWEVACLERAEGKESLEDRGHVAAASGISARLRPERETKSHLFPRFASPVKPGPNTGSSAFPDSSVREKSKLRFCSIWSSVIDFSVLVCVWTLIPKVDKCSASSGSSLESLQT